MKQLKMFLMLLLTSILFIPKTFAIEIDGANFDNAIGYDGSNNIVYRVLEDINNQWYIDGGVVPRFGVRLQATDTTSVSTGQLILYVNMCYRSDNSIIEQESIDNTTGSLVKLQKIGQSVQNGACQFSGWSGDLIQTSWVMNFNLVRSGSSGNSFLDSTINFYLPENVKEYNTTMKFVNVYIDKYDESIVQSIKQAQISETTNQELSNINSKINDTNNKLDSANNKLDSANNKLDSILDNSSPDLGGLSNSSTWLPQGPVDSIIMLPLNFINTIIDKLSGTCSPVNLPIPFMQNKYIVLPCLNTIFENIEGFSTLFNLVGVIGSVYLLYNYFVRFYKWVDDTLSFRENTWQDWGGD